MADSRKNPVKTNKSNDIFDTLQTTKLDELLAECRSTEERGLGAQDCNCCGKRSPCSPCGSCGPVRCPCNLSCPPIGPKCCTIIKPQYGCSCYGCNNCCNNCHSCCNGCCGGCNGCKPCYRSCCFPRRPLGKPRCVGSA